MSDFKWAEPIVPTKIVGEKHEVVKEKISFKFPMDKRILTESGKLFSYSFIQGKLIFFYLGSCYAEVK